VGPRGAWLVACRQGKAPRLELTAGSGSAEAIDDLLGWDPTGQFVVVREAGSAWLREIATGTSVNLAELDFDDRDDTLDNRQHRALAFDPRGELLAYVRRGKRPRIALRELATGKEHEVTGVPGEPWRIAWNASGETLVVSTVSEDTTKNGQLDSPVRTRKGPRTTCSGLLPRFRATAETGDRPTSVLISRDGALVRPAPGFVLPFGTAYVSRSADGALALERPGARQTLADAECGGRVVLSDPSRNLVLVACTNDKVKPKRLGLELVGPGYRQELGLMIQSLALDRWPEAPLRLLPLYPGSDTLLLDLDTKQLVPLKPGDRVLTTSGTFALVRRERRLLWVDATSGAETTLLGEIEPFAGLVVEGSMVAVGRLVVDAASGRVLGSVSGRPLALTPAGEALVAEGGAPSAEAYARGPLRWHAPTPLPAPAPTPVATKEKTAK
jgi:hypothetical protein